MNGEASRGLDATGRVRAHALEDARVYAQQAVYPEIVSETGERQARAGPRYRYFSHPCMWVGRQVGVCVCVEGKVAREMEFN